MHPPPPVTPPTLPSFGLLLDRLPLGFCRHPVPSLARDTRTTSTSVSPLITLSWGTKERLAGPQVGGRRKSSRAHPRQVPLTCRPTTSLLRRLPTPGKKEDPRGGLGQRVVFISKQLSFGPNNQSILLEHYSEHLELRFYSFLSLLPYPCSLSVP